MTPNQKTFEYEGGRLTRSLNMPITKLVGCEYMVKYRNCPQYLSPNIKAYIDGWFAQDTELTLEVS